MTELLDFNCHILQLAYNIPRKDSRISRLKMLLCFPVWHSSQSRNSRLESDCQ
eukprot:c42560_g1_i1 orf=63-221(+)